MQSRPRREGRGEGACQEEDEGHTGCTSEQDRDGLCLSFVILICVMDVIN